MIRTIDAAILAHRAWVSRFRHALRGSNNEIFDLANTADDKACELGQWLLSTEAAELLSEHAHQRISTLHQTFHDIAGEIAGQLNRNRTDHATTEEYLQEFDNLSKQLVELLFFAKRKNETPAR